MELTLSGILVWLMTGGCVIAISWLAERFNWFGALSTAKKKLIQWGGSTGLGLGAWAILKFVPPETLTMLEDPFKIVVGSFVVIFLNQAYHNWVRTNEIRKADYARSARGQ